MQTKKLFITLIVFFVFFMVINHAHAVDKTIVFAWDPHPQINIIKNFEMHWSDQAGGPYAQLVVVTKEDAIDNTEPIQATVTGPSGTSVTRFFVLKACGDVIQEDGSTLYQCSVPSNEVSSSFWIPADGYSAPVNFRIESEN